MTAALLVLLLHGDGVSSSRIEIAGREAIVTFTVSMEDLADLARLDLDRNGTVDPEEWTKVLPAIFAYMGDRFRIDGCRSDGDRGLLPPAMALKDRRAPVTLRMRYAAPRPLDRLRIRCTLFQEHDGTPRHVAELPGGRVLVFDRERPESEAPTTDRGSMMTPWAAGAIVAVIVAAAAVSRFAWSGAGA